MIVFVKTATDKATTGRSVSGTLGLIRISPGLAFRDAAATAGGVRFFAEAFWATAFSCGFPPALSAGTTSPAFIASLLALAAAFLAAFF